nr:hypothetical protein [uncultured Boseongicola sp.]
MKRAVACADVYKLVDINWEHEIGCAKHRHGLDEAEGSRLGVATSKKAAGVGQQGEVAARVEMI